MAQPQVGGDGRPSFDVRQLIESHWRLPDWPAPSLRLLPEAIQAMHANLARGTVTASRIEFLLRLSQPPSREIESECERLQQQLLLIGPALDPLHPALTRARQLVPGVAPKVYFLGRWFNHAHDALRFLVEAVLGSFHVVEMSADALRVRATAAVEFEEVQQLLIEAQAEVAYLPAALRALAEEMSAAAPGPPCGGDGAAAPSPVTVSPVAPVDEGPPSPGSQSIGPQGGQLRGKESPPWTEDDLDGLQRIPRLLVRFMWDHRCADLEVVSREVWGEPFGLLNERYPNALKAAIKKANSFLVPLGHDLSKEGRRLVLA